MSEANPADHVELPAAILRRWQEAGGIWRVVGRTRTSVTVSLSQCTGGDEVHRISSADPALLDYLAGREASDDPE